MTLLLLALLSPALADDKIVVLRAGEAFKATSTVFVLPAPAYDACLTKAEALETLKAEALKAAEASTQALGDAQTALSACQLASAVDRQALLGAQGDLKAAREHVKVVQSQKWIWIVASVGLTGALGVETYLWLTP